MNSPAHPPLLLVAGIGALVAFRMYRRAIRLVGRQLFRPARSWSSLVFFPLLVLALIVVMASHPLSAAGELVGFAIGVCLAIYGIRLTKFEVTDQGLYYTPNAHIGIALSLLLALRVVYRFVLLNYSPGAMSDPQQSLSQAPLTLLIIGTLAGYYAAYALGLIRWARSMPNPA